MRSPYYGYEYVVKSNPSVVLEQQAATTTATPTPAPSQKGVGGGGWKNGKKKKSEQDRAGYYSKLWGAPHQQVGSNHYVQSTLL